MTGKNLYDLLGVAPNATDDQIRKAYLLRSKMMHPDRFDQTRQRAEWELANEILKELNHAYQVLRDSSSRSQYDRKIAGATHSAPPPRQSSPPPQQRSGPPPNIKLGRLQAGSAHFPELPPTVQQRLTERVSRTNKVQYAYNLHGVGWHYFLAVLLFAWLVYLLIDSFGAYWDKDVLDCMIGVTFMAAVFQSMNLSWMIRWHRSPLGCWWLVTPLYVIKTQFDQVSFWPIWEIRDIQTTHNYRDGFHNGTDVYMTFGSSTEYLRLSSRSAYDKMMSALRAFDQTVRRAKAQEDWNYFFEQDDFREFVPDPNKKKTPSSSFPRSALLFATFFGLYGLVFACAYAINKRQAPPSLNRSAPARAFPSPTPRHQPRSTPSAHSTPQPFLEPELSLPPSGECRRYTRKEAIAPFQLRSSAGTNYLVKLVDARTNSTSLTVFVQGGDTAEVQVPLGSYVVKYATGKKWYGYRYLFGPTTGYSKADKVFTFRREGDQVAGFTIILYETTDGNLDTDPIPAESF
jgi:hypothetical protein